MSDLRIVPDMVHADWAAFLAVPPVTLDTTGMEWVVDHARGYADHQLDVLPPRAQVIRWRCVTITAASPVAESSETVRKILVVSEASSAIVLHCTATFTWPYVCTCWRGTTWPFISYTSFDPDIAPRRNGDAMQDSLRGLRCAVHSTAPWQKAP